MLRVSSWLMLAVLVTGAGVLIASVDPSEQQDSLQKAPVSSQKAPTIDEAMSIADARKLIERGEKLETVPKTVWRQLLTAEQYRILWKKGTERAFTGGLLSNKEAGTYVTAGCRLPVFHSSHKFKSGTGWPSFWEVVNKDNVVLKTDWSWGMRRTEVLSSCGEHLGHVFDDGPNPSGLRYCINSEALLFVPDKQTATASQGSSRLLSR